MSIVETDPAIDEKLYSDTTSPFMPVMYNWSVVISTCHFKYIWSPSFHVKGKNVMFFGLLCVPRGV